jgi:hypothetical protein
MFKEADILTTIISEEKATKYSHSILSREPCQLSYKKAYFLLLHNISEKHTMVYCYTTCGIFYWYAVNGISGKTDLVPINC